MKKIALCLMALTAFVLASTPAHAVTQCELKMKRVWADSTGVVWLDFANDTGVGIAATNPGKEMLMSLGVSALLSGRSVIVRYAADGANCNVTRNDFLGMYII